MTNKKTKTLGMAAGAFYSAAILIEFIRSIVGNYRIMHFYGYSYFELNWPLFIIWAPAVFLIVTLFLDNLKLEQIAAGIVVLLMLFSPAGPIGGLIFRSRHSAFYFFTGLFFAAAAGLALAALLKLGKKGKILGFSAAGVVLFNVLLALVWGLLAGSASFVGLILMLNRCLFMALAYLLLALYVEEKGKMASGGFAYTPAKPYDSAGQTALRQTEEAPASAGSFWSDDIQPWEEEENRNGAPVRDTNI